MLPILAAAMVGSGVVTATEYSKKDYTDMIDNVTDSIGDTFDEAYEKLSQSGEKQTNYAQQAAAAVYGGAMTATAVAGGIAGGVTGGVTGAMTVAALGDWEGIDSFSSAADAAKMIMAGGAAGSIAGGTLGSITGGGVMAQLYKNTPFLDPSGADIAEMEVKGAKTGLGVGVSGAAMGAALALGTAVTIEEVEKAMGHVEKEAAMAMDNALNSGLAFADGLPKTTKDIMKNVNSFADDLSKSAGKANKDVQKAINSGIDTAAESVKSFADMGEDALKEAGTMLDDIGIDKLFREETTVEKIASAMGGFMDSIGDSFTEMMEESEQGLEDLAELGNEAIVALGLEKEMDAVMKANKDIGSDGGAMGKQWVKPHKRAGRAVKGFWRKLRG
jgi:hypothetical protein